MSTGNLKAAKQSSPLEELLNLPLRGANPYVQEWQASGGKVIGYICSYTPEELIYAIPAAGGAKIMPVRLGAAGCTHTEDADTLMYRFLCTFTRSLLQMGLDGEYSYLNGVVFTSTCEHIRRSFEFWRDLVKPEIITMVSVPRTRHGETQFKWYYEECVNMLEEIGKRWGTFASSDQLRESIKTYNRYRKLMLELYSLRSIKEPKLTGSEAFKIMQAGFNLPKDLFNQKLEAAIEELKARPGIKDYRARVLLLGSYTDDTSLIDTIESTGALVVTDGLCSGKKYVESMVDENAKDPVEALTRRYLSKVACPRMMDGAKERIEYTMKLAKEAEVAGVILQHITFCDMHNVENIVEDKALVKAGIPTLSLEREYNAADTGRLKTRVQAFLEKMGR